MTEGTTGTLPLKPFADATVCGLVRRWLDDLCFCQTRSPATLVSYEVDVRKFLEFYRDHTGGLVTFKALTELKAPDWRAWLVQQKTNGVVSRTLAQRLSALKNFYRFLSKEGLLADPPVLSARPPKVPRNLPRPLFFEDIMSLMQTCEVLAGDPWVHRRDEALIFLIYALGLRISEALGLDIEDLREGETLTIHGKRNKIRRVPFLPPIRRKITIYLEAYALAHGREVPQAGPMFLAERGGRLSKNVFQRRIATLRKLLGLPDTVTPHALRHSCASHLMANSENLREIQELLGHASLSSTQIYTKLENDQLMDAYQRSHPIASYLNGREDSFVLSKVCKQEKIEDATFQKELSTQDQKGI